MTRPVPDFDVEKRRRWYAVTIGVFCSSGLLAIFLLTEDLGSTDDPLWMTVLALFAFWLLFFIFKFVAGYAVWFSPYSSRKRAVALSVASIFAVYLAFTGGSALFILSSGTTFGLKDILKAFFSFNTAIYGVPYLIAAIVGYIFARPAPDAQEHF